MGKHDYDGAADGDEVEYVDLTAEQWTTDLCGCHDDCSIFCYTCLCPSAAYGENMSGLRGAAAVPASSQAWSRACWAPCLTHLLCGGLVACLMQQVVPVPCNPACCVTCLQRRALRRKHKLPGSACGDMCSHALCGPCAMYQDTHYLRARQERGE